MYDFLQDVRYGIRMLAKSPVLVAVAAVSLAMGIVANTTTFAVANGFLFAPWPFEDQDELMLVWEIHQKDDDEQAVSPGNFLDYRERTTVFEDLVAYDIVPANLTGGEEPERVRLVPTSPKTFPLLGREPVLGRDFEEGEGVAGQGSVVILSHPFWKRYFGQDRAVLGRTVTLDGKPFTVVGVMPEDFDFLPADVDIFRPTSWADRREDRERTLLLIGRLKPGRSREEAQAEVETISAQLAKEHPETNEGYHARVMGMRDYFPGPTDTWLMYILLTVAGFVLLIACANIANLLLARAESRQREVAVRTALGAGRSRILRQLLTESVLLALLGGVLGTVLSVYTIRWVSESMPAMLPRSFMPELDAAVLLYTLALSMLAGIVFGVAPALHTFGDLREALGENSRGGTTTRKRNRLRSAFVVTELAAALALLIGAGALLNIFQKFVMANPGFEVKGVLTAQLTASENRHPDNADLRIFYREVIRRLGETPGIESVAAMAQLPRSRAESRTKFTIDGRPTPRYNEEPETGWQSVNAAYFEALGVPVLSGRSIAGADLEDSAPVAVVNESFVETFFPEEDPIGKGLTVMGKSRRIVGVSKNIYQTRMPERGAKIGPVLYLPMEQEPVRSMSFAMRVRGEPTSFASGVRAAVWAVDPEQPVSAVQPLTDHIATELAGPNILLIVLSVFGSMALLLSAIGVYGVMAHGVAQKTREIGIRMALGAGATDVVRLVTFQGLRLLALGFVLGAPFAFALTRAVRAAFSSSVSVASPELVLAVTAVLAFVAALATYLPARRASRLQPVRALSTE
jgi:putative ABC transport system permease protein